MEIRQNNQPISDSLLAHIHINDLFFDIETTGFQKDTTILYMIGCAYLEGTQLHCIQWFNEDAVSEPTILTAFAELLGRRSWTLISFNGDNFDLPYLRRHFALNNLPIPFEEHSSLDLYPVLRPYQKLLGLEHGRQKDWEQFLGIHREDKYDGGKLIAIYREFLSKKKEEHANLLYLHNLEDLCGLPRLLPLLSYPALSQEQFSFEDISPNRQAIEGTDECLSLQCRLYHALPQPLRVCSHVGILYAVNDTMTLTIPVFTGILRHYFKDYTNYYYLPEEDRAVHKSVGCYVDKTHRKKATASTCYIHKNSVFLPLPPTASYGGMKTDLSGYPEDLLLYQETVRSRESYADFDALFAQDPSVFSYYLGETTRWILMEGLKNIHNYGILERNFEKP